MTKLCKLITKWPAGAVGVQAWLQKQQIYKQLSNKYVASGWLIKIGKGAYMRAGDKLTWHGGVYALQKDLGLKIHVGGLSALELLGRSHFVPMGAHSRIYLYANSRDVPRYLPKWFQELKNVTHIYVLTELFSSNLALMDFDCGSFTIQISEPERALFEMLSLVPHKMSFDHACLLMEHQHDLRSDVVQQLLEECKSQVLKRLFLYLARQFNLDFMPRVSLKNVNIGRGLRHIGNGEVYDRKLDLYVPKMSPDIDPNQEVPDV